MAISDKPNKNHTSIFTELYINLPDTIHINGTCFGVRRMKISMHILAKWLDEYNPTLYIEEGLLTILTIQLYTKQDTFLDECVYIGRACDILEDADEGDQKIVCMNNSDIIILDVFDKELIANKILEALVFYNQWENNLNKAVFEKKSFQELIDIAHTVFELPMCLYNWRNELLGITRQYKDVGLYWNHSVESNEINNDVYNILMYDTPGSEEFVEGKVSYAYFYWAEMDYPSLFYRIPFNNSVVCSFTICGYGRMVTEADRQLAEYFSEILFQIDEYDPIYSQIRPATSIFKNILENKQVPREEIDKILFELDWHDKTSWKLAVFDNFKEGIMNAQILNQLFSKKINDAVCFEYNEKNIIIMPADNCLKHVKKTIDEIPDAQYICGVSLPFSEWNNLNFALTQAETAINYGNENQVNQCEHHVWHCLIDVMIEKCYELQMVHPDVIAIFNYDKVHNTELIKTLYTFLKNKFRTRQTAEALYIHINTLKYRIKKIHEIIGIDIKDYEHLEYIFLSCELVMRDKYLSMNEIV